MTEAEKEEKKLIEERNKKSRMANRASCIKDKKKLDELNSFIEKNPDLEVEIDQLLIMLDADKIINLLKKI